MNTTIWTALLLILLGFGSVAATAAMTALIPAVFGVLLLLPGLWMRRAASGRTAQWMALGIGVLGLLAPLANLARAIAANGFVINAATIANIAMALICGGYLLLWALQRRGLPQSSTS